MTKRDFLTETLQAIVIERGMVSDPAKLITDLKGVADESEAASEAS